MAVKQPGNPLIPELTIYKMLGKYHNSLCPGCGYGIVANCINKVIRQQGNPLAYPFIAGIGCNSQIAKVLVGPSFQTLHGRTIPFATGLKLANPGLKPIVITGDGDSLAIGLGHFMHAARRNVDMVMLLLNNEIFGMTGGQMAPTTPCGVRTTTTPAGMTESSFDGVKVAITAGATFVARWTVAQPFQIIKSLEKALDHQGFSVIEIMSICPTYRGRLNGLPEAVTMLRKLKEDTISVKEPAGKSEDELAQRHVVGEFLERKDKPELSRQYQEALARVRPKDS